MIELNVRHITLTLISHMVLILSCLTILTWHMNNLF